MNSAPRVPLEELPRKISSWLSPQGISGFASFVWTPPSFLVKNGDNKWLPWITEWARGSGHSMSRVALTCSLESRGSGGCVGGLSTLSVLCWREGDVGLLPLGTRQGVLVSSTDLEAVHPDTRSLTLTLACCGTLGNLSLWRAQLSSLQRAKLGSPGESF